MASRCLAPFLAIILIMASALHGGLAYAGTQPAADSHLLLNQQIEGVSSNHSHGAPWQHPLEQHDNGQASSCAAVGCPLCGEAPTASPIAQDTLPRMRPDPAASLISVAVAPQLRPPAILG
jgi:hypothetical protein